MASVRTFIAINLDDALHAALAEAIEKFASSKASVKWVPPHNAHLTLKFLGNVEEARLPEVFAACESAARDFPPIELALGTIGCFPNMKRPRIVWLGMEKGADEVKQLQHNVESELKRIGFPKEDRKFKAHLTIGRVKKQQGLSRLSQLIEEDRDIFIGSMRAEKISVMKSKVLPGGPVYTELKAIPLQ